MADLSTTVQVNPADPAIKALKHPMVPAPTKQTCRTS